MKRPLYLLIFVSALSFQTSYALNPAALLAPSDSIPSGQESSFSQFRIAYQPSLRASPRFYTTVKRPAQSGSELQKQEIALAHVGINDQTIAVTVGGTILEAGKDYKYIPSTNRIQLLNPEILRSSAPIEISYDTLKWQLNR